MAQERRLRKTRRGQAGNRIAAAEEATSNVEQLSQVQEATATEDDKKENKRGGGGGRKKLKKLRQKVKATEAALEAAQQQVAETPAYPLARPAQMRRRHWGLIASFVLMVLAPLAAAVFYLWAVAEDQYISTAGFTVRSQESGGATDILGGLANFA